MAQRTSIGAILISQRKYIAIVENRGRVTTYGFPKGGQEEGESDEETLFREIEEETTLEREELRVETFLGQYSRADGLTGNEKAIRLYLVTTTAQPKERGGIQSNMAHHLRWYKKGTVAEHLTHQEDRDFYNSLDLTAYLD